MNASRAPAVPTAVLDPRSATGLSEAEAAERLAADGANELPSSERRGFLRIAGEVVREPMILLLIAAGTLYLFLGDLREALVLLFSVLVVVTISLYQNHKTERALERLRDLSSPRALVIRDGSTRRIPGREVVRGDLLVVSEGDRVAADARVLWSVNLSADESLLTGESVPVRKRPGTETEARRRPGGDDNPDVYSGTLVVSGQGIARVLETGSATEMGKIGETLRTVEPEGTPLQRETARLVRRVAVVAVALCALAAVLYGLTRRDWSNGLLAGIALAMAILPEEFPVVLTVFLALGAWRLSRHRVLTRRLPAIETLGAATVLCVDKTGTLTLNRMAVAKLVAGGETFDASQETAGAFPEPFHALVEYGILASQRDPFDPMERAIGELGRRELAGTEHLHGDWELVREYPLSDRLLAMSHVWRSPGGERFVIAAKGAPEAIADLCHLAEPAAEELFRRTRALASEGLRIIAVAGSSFEKGRLPGDQHDFPFELIGLIALEDPIRPEVPGAVRECREAGIRVLLVTGDYPETAAEIARQIGAPEGPVVTGTDLDAMDEAALRERLRTATVFARAVPEHKLRLMRALQSDGEIVAMTGDGVNDAPALKAADIGVAMGGRGTDVARETADLVLLDDNFVSLVEAVRVGRRIFANLRKAIAYLLAIHVPIAGMSLIPLALGWPLVLMPVHIVFLELIIDPACSLVFEAEREEADVMRRPPRDPREPLFSRGTVRLALLQGVSLLVVVFAVFAVALWRGQGEDDARALSFTTLVLANLGLIFANRSWSRSVVESFARRNTALAWVAGGAVGVLALVLGLPALRSLFHFSKLHPVDLAVCVGAALASVTGFEIFKLRRRLRT